MLNIFTQLQINKKKNLLKIFNNNNKLIYWNNYYYNNQINFNQIQIDIKWYIL